MVYVQLPEGSGITIKYGEKFLTFQNRDSEIECTRSLSTTMPEMRIDESERVIVIPLANPRSAVDSRQETDLQDGQAVINQGNS